MNIRPPAIFLMGPTASGKTGVAVELAQHLPIELISVDSALVFRDMDIGTAKPDAATLARAPHHLIDIIDPTEAYSAAAFRKDALRLMADITARGKVPLLVGGTMLYYKALREGLSPLPQADAALRAQLDAEIAQHGIEALHVKLAEVDAETAARLHSTDTQRVQRAMEIYLASGKPMSELIKQQEQNPLPYEIISIALVPSDRSVLHDRIASRFEKMLSEGLVDELRSLRDKYPLHRDMTSMRCVGYRQSWEYLEGEIDEAGLMEKGIAATRQLAKRQLTWLRSMPQNIEVDCLAEDLYERVLANIKSKVRFSPV
ncbi:MAG: tRNA (adenosine(37)-N6)-dimethylallyltransferase MiaA [Gammaproteobacteria bacterium]|nr:tRNA (adenosine(37)-N6)-dimethylallyltransferase MiaA [Sideroxydans sp.]MBU3903181.1 tRNA (adenosine(37)-N6)-dimethylallyltransferase MiaA [Gammaproteobacteria bacterium]MBU4045256.1 tRNA (adenosine(37)-N6)-dimethylallyltransferase MiaA [Gammaproteobacteria bacterium]MBU4151128.1 tRNA (adenosine(37)-N6)-dimethylallyltransferase MiaA [Gammaproteobacteria bacterium]